MPTCRFICNNLYTDYYVKGFSESIEYIGKRRSMKSCSLELNINNFVVKIKDNIWKKTCVYNRITGSETLA